MDRWKQYFRSPAASPQPTDDEVGAFAARYEWFLPARILRARVTGRADAVLSIGSPWRVESSLLRPQVDAEQLVRRTPEELIDRFLREEDLRIVADEDAPEIEVRTSPDLAEEEELVSEELAGIYLAQGLRDEAVAIYRKLSLLNPEKSVYFAELISKTENNN